MNPIILAFASAVGTGICLASDPWAAALARLQRLQPPARLSPELKARVVESLPKEGEVREPTAMQRERLAGLAAVLKVHGREEDYLLKVVKSRQARLAIYARSVVLITDTALRVLSPTQFQALVAHEVGHEYVWDEFEEARKQSDHAKLRELELVCDGVAILTLHRLGAPVSALIDGLRAMANSDRSNGLEVDGRSHPTLSERAQFARRVAP
jgi:hypothetical protein